MRGEKGITLLALVVFIITTTIALSVLATISNYFFKNVNYLNSKARFAAEFDKFNAYFVQDVKHNYRANIQVPTEEEPYLDTVVAFGNGNRYIYYTNPSEEHKNIIYRVSINKDDEGNILYNEDGQYAETIIPIATNITKFSVKKETPYINDVDKVLLTVEIKIGEGNDTQFWHTLTYTLKYW